MPASLTPARIQRLRDLPADAHVRVWTFQSLAAQESAQALGYWTGSERHAVEDFAGPYAWMREQMAERLPAYSGDYPVWAYLSRPNMRKMHYDVDRVLVTADVPLSRVLLSDYSLWHYPLNGWCVSRTQEERDAFEASGVQTWGEEREPCAVMRSTWELIFDLGLRTDPDLLEQIGQVRDVQACVDRIYPSEVVRVTPAPGRLGRNGGRDW